MLAQLPPWTGLHPLVVHFPVALLVVAPLLVLLGLVPSKSARGFWNSALVLMLLGTLGAFVAVETGEATAELADKTPEIGNLIAMHSELAEKTRLAFAALTALFAVLLFLPALLRRERTRRVSVVLGLAFLCLYGAGTVLLVKTGDAGARLVHQEGVHAILTR